MTRYLFPLRRLALAPLAVALVVLAGQPALAAPTADQLKSATVTTDDLGPGFRQTLATPISEPVMGYTARFERDENDMREIVVVLLLDANGGTTRDTALAYFAGLQQTGPQGNAPDVAVAESEAPAIGEEAVQYAYSLAFIGRNEQGEATPFFLRGEVLVWKQGEVIAMVGTLGANAAKVGPYAAAQLDRLTRTMS